MKRLVLTIIVSTLFLSGAMAYELDGKWAGDIKKAQELYVLTKDGNQESKRALVSLAKLDGHAPYKHILGTHLEYREQDLKSACQWYSAAARLEYPPSIHSFAECLIRHLDEGDIPIEKRDSINRLVLNLLTHALSKGWTPSAVLLSDHLANVIDSTQIDRSEMKELARIAERASKIKSTREEYAAIHLIKAMRWFFGHEENYMPFSSTSNYFYAFEDDLSTVFEYDDDKQFGSVANDLRYGVYEISSEMILKYSNELGVIKDPQSCYRGYQVFYNKSLPEDLAKQEALEKCKDEFQRELRNLVQAEEDATYLLGKLTDSDREAFEYAVKAIKSQRQQFKKAHDQYMGLFYSEYVSQN